MSNDYSIVIDGWEEDGEWVYHVMFARGKEEPQVIANGSVPQIEDSFEDIKDSVREVWQ